MCGFTNRLFSKVNGICASLRIDKTTQRCLDVRILFMQHKGYAKENENNKTNIYGNNSNNKILTKIFCMTIDMPKREVILTW